MSAVVHTLNDRGFKTVRPSDDDLHRAARKYLLEAGDILFGNLPGIIGQIIEHKAWKSRLAGFKGFAEYALAQTSEGLNINNNQKLWMLRCSLDVTGKHIKEWAEVLTQVEEIVRFQVATTGSKIDEFRSNSLKTLSKEWPGQARISYLPSQNKTTDGQLFRLRKNHPGLYRRALKGEMEFRSAIRQAGMERRDLVDRAIYSVKHMDRKDLARFIEWLRSEGYV